MSSIGPFPVPSILLIVPSLISIRSELQSKFEAEQIAKKKAAGRKMVWLGYLTDKPHGSSYTRLTDAGAVDVIPSEWNRYCLYLFHMGMNPSDFAVCLSLTSILVVLSSRLIFVFSVAL